MADQVDLALLRSQRQGKPLLALGTMKTCAPCVQLKQTLKSSSLQSVISKCVVLKMDAESPEFAHFANRFPADTSIVPMVYVILPDGTQMYAQGGTMAKGDISNLLHEAVSYSTSLKQSTDQVAFQQILTTAKDKARDQKLIDALRIATQLANQPGDIPVLIEAREYRDRLVEAIAQWLQDLDQQMSSNSHGAAYRIAQIFVELPEHKGIHLMAGRLLIQYDKDEATRSAVAQAKHLLKARYRQDDDKCQDAIDSYRRVVEIDAASPAGRYAAKQLLVLRQKQASKLTLMGG